MCFADAFEFKFYSKVTRLTQKCSHFLCLVVIKIALCVENVQFLLLFLNCKTTYLLTKMTISSASAQDQYVGMVIVCMLMSTSPKHCLYDAFVEDGQVAFWSPAAHESKLPTVSRPCSRQTAMRCTDCSGSV